MCVILKISTHATSTVIGDGWWYFVADDDVEDEGADNGLDDGDDDYIFDNVDGIAVYWTSDDKAANVADDDEGDDEDEYEADEVENEEEVEYGDADKKRKYFYDLRRISHLLAQSSFDLLIDGFASPKWSFLFWNRLLNGFGNLDSYFDTSDLVGNWPPYSQITPRGSRLCTEKESYIFPVVRL